MRFIRGIAKFFRSEAGPTATEYAVALALVLMAVLVAVKTFGNGVKTEFTTTTAKLPKGKALAP